jgi:hypothetical protein
LSAAEEEDDEEVKSSVYDLERQQPAPAAAGASLSSSEEADAEDGVMVRSSSAANMERMLESYTRNVDSREENHQHQPGCSVQ